MAADTPLTAAASAGLTRPRHAAVSKTDPDGMRVRHRRDLVVTTYAMPTRQDIDSGRV